MANLRAISELLRRATEAGDVPGVVIAAAAADGAIFADAAGVRDISTNAPMTVDTVIWIASMTKAVTSACAMQLVEQGRLSLDEPIAAVLPELANVQTLEGFASDGSPRLRPARRPITLRHLLTHSSGFVYEIWNPVMARYVEATGTQSISSCANASLRLPLLFDPGERWDYGIGIDWAGKAVEAVSGQRLGAYMKAHLLEPLGMNDTAFHIGPAQRQRLAKVHVRTAASFEATDQELPQDPEFEMGGGGLYSTVGDYLRFAQMIMHGGMLEGRRILAPETVAIMSANAMGDLRCCPLKTAAPALSNDVDFIDGMQWGLSFLINPQPLPTGRSAGSLAWAGLANSYFWIDQVKQVAGVFATQLLPFFDDRAVRLFQEFETAVYRMA
jgi:methyl acetate hydrolase